MGLPHMHGCAWEQAPAGAANAASRAAPALSNTLRQGTAGQQRRGAPARASGSCYCSRRYSALARQTQPAGPPPAQAPGGSVMHAAHAARGFCAPAQAAQATAAPPRAQHGAGGGSCRNSCRRRRPYSAGSQTAASARAAPTRGRAQAGRAHRSQPVGVGTSSHSMRTASSSTKVGSPSRRRGAGAAGTLAAARQAAAAVSSVRPGTGPAPAPGGVLPAQALASAQLRICSAARGVPRSGTGAARTPCCTRKLHETVKPGRREGSLGARIAAMQFKARRTAKRVGLRGLAVPAEGRRGRAAVAHHAAARGIELR